MTSSDVIIVSRVSRGAAEALIQKLSLKGTDKRPVLKDADIGVCEDGVVIVLDGDCDPASGVVVRRDICWVDDIVVVSVKVDCCWC